MTKMINALVESKINDEYYTPKYAIEPLIKYLKAGSTILCPFDEDKSNFVKVLKENGFKVINSHIRERERERDFFDYSVEDIKRLGVDYIISNPPYSIKSKVIKKLYDLKCKWIMLMPLTTLEGIERDKLYRKYGVQLLVFDKRINFMKEKKANWFNTSYFGWNVFPKDLIFEELNKEE